MERFAQTDSDELSEAPLELVQYEDSSDQFLIFGNEDGGEVQLLFGDGEPWFTQAQLARVFGSSVPNVNEHIKKFFADGELDDSVIRKFRITAADGKRYNTNHYGLDVAFYVGYRVNSAAGVLFRRWATHILIQYAKNGFVVDKRRLEDPANFDRVKELRKIVKELRNSEANLYAELRDICAMCSDYDPKSDAATKFFKFTQAKIFYAVTSLTPSAFIADQADASSENMGLLTWNGKKGVTKKDVTVAKNYLADAQLEEFSRLVSIILDIFDDQLKMGRLTTMTECSARLDEELARLGRLVLRNPGPPSSDDAKAYAISEYVKFDEGRKLAKEKKAQEELAALKATAKALPKTKAKPKKAAQKKTSAQKKKPQKSAKK